MLQFEFRTYPGDGEGSHAERPDVTFPRHATHGAAKSAAGRLAKRIGGPVDIAIAGAADWADRYVTTAQPSSFHKAGYRFERLT